MLVSAASQKAQSDSVAWKTFSMGFLKTKARVQVSLRGVHMYFNNVVEN